MKSNLNKSTSANYQLVFPKLPFSTNLEDSEILSLNIHSTVIPSMTLSNVEMNWMGGKYDFATPPIIFEPWYTQFTVDANYKNWYLLYRWMTLINDNKDHYDRIPKDYWTDASLSLIDNFKKKVMNIKIVNMFPTMLGEISLSHREGEVNLESSVNFNYTRFEVDYIKNA